MESIDAHAVLRSREYGGCKHGDIVWASVLEPGGARRYEGTYYGRGDGYDSDVIIIQDDGGKLVCIKKLDLVRFSYMPLKKDI